MPIKEFGKGLRESLLGAAESAKDKVRDIDTTELKENIQSVAGAVRDKVTESGRKASEQVKEIFQRKDADEEKGACDYSVVPTRSALKVIYFLMAADGEVFHGEEEKFNDIGRELDPDFEHTRDSLIGECRAILDLADSKSYAETLQSGVEQTLSATRKPDGAYIPSKLLVWDLLSVAYSDENYNDAERELIEYVAEMLNLDKAIFLEMQSSILTMLDLEKELNWVKTTDWPYLTIEAHVKEIENRKTAISESIMALISL